MLYKKGHCSSIQVTLAAPGAFGGHYGQASSDRGSQLRLDPAPWSWHNPHRGETWNTCHKASNIESLLVSETILGHKLVPVQS